MSSDITVLYIGGSGRSGSTFIERILNQLDDIVVVGEFRHLLRWGFAKNILCTCNTPLNKCQFWGNVLEAAFFEEKDFQEIQLLRNQVDRIKYIPLMFFPKLSQNFSLNLNKYQNILSRFYNAISEVSGKRIIVDSTKYPSTYFLARSLKEVDVRLLHLVRDPRGVAYSWQKKKKLRPEFIDSKVYMSQKSALQSSLTWAHWNLWFEYAKHLHLDEAIFLRYEEFISNPNEKLIEIIDFLGISTELDIKDNRVIINQESHSISGNPIRFQQGEIEIKIDDAWKYDLNWLRRWTVTALTWPLLLLYGYKL